MSQFQDATRPAAAATATGSPSADRTARGRPNDSLGIAAQGAASDPPAPAGVNFEVASVN